MKNKTITMLVILGTFTPVFGGETTTTDYNATNTNHSLLGDAVQSFLSIFLPEQMEDDSQGSTPKDVLRERLKVSEEEKEKLKKSNEILAAAAAALEKSNEILAAASAALDTKKTTARCGRIGFNDE